MLTPRQLRNRLIRKLDELFQLDQPDLDFGFYKIMHAKSVQIRKFIDKDLLKDAAESLPEQSDDVKEKSAWDRSESLDSDLLRGRLNTQADLYDHLYRFFERYYDGGDFMSLRHLGTATGKGATAYAIPYSGEEVKLHWANADQYYIKSTEHFSNFTFDLRQGADKHDLDADTPLAERENTPLRMHFRLVDAAEGEHGNIKENGNTKRFFIVEGAEPVRIDNGDLVVNFQYRPDAKKPKNKNGWQEKLNEDGALAISTAIEEGIAALENGRPAFGLGSAEDADIEGIKERLRLLSLPLPGKKDGSRTLLTSYIKQYTGRNTMDYFIHKDLGGFLRRELDFYIKNEVVRLDDIEEIPAESMLGYIKHIKSFRRIATTLIDFLAQLEDFQKKLWLKKKFVVETNYCITLDRVPESLYQEIAGNEAQIDEWIKLFAIDEIGDDLNGSGFSRPLTGDFLKANDKLVLDTRFFDDELKSRLLESITSLDEQCDGLLVHSENSQALSLLNNRYRCQVKCIYIDPPYNTSENAFLYKNTYKHSSWMSMINNSLSISPVYLMNSGVLLCAIDDTEYSSLKSILSEAYGSDNYLATVAVEVNPAGQNIRPNVPSRSHDYFHIFSKWSQDAELLERELSPQEQQQYSQTDEIGNYYWDNLRRRGGNSRPSDRPKQWFPLYILKDRVRIPEMTWSDNEQKWVIKEELRAGEEEVWPVDPKGEKRIWRVSPEGARDGIDNNEIEAIRKSGRWEISKKSREPNGKKPKTLWKDSAYSATSHGTKLLIDILGNGHNFSYPKSIHLVKDAIRHWLDKSDLSLDFFAGSGTTGHAVVNLNREDGGSRKYILVEMGDYFDTVLRPRISKVIYSEKWKGGKPVSRHTGVSHCYKYIRLESYEDTLNNLRVDEAASGSAVMGNKSLKQQFVVNYMLDVETRGSQSLLNIDDFVDPTAYSLSIKKPGSDEYESRNIDLIETFNYLIGLRVERIHAPESFTAEFERDHDPLAPDDKQTRMRAKEGSFKQDNNGPWWFRAVEGWLPESPHQPNSKKRARVLVIWRKLGGKPEEDDTVLLRWFADNFLKKGKLAFDTVYVNGSTALPRLKAGGEQWDIRLTEAEFKNRMWDTAE